MRIKMKAMMTINVELCNIALEKCIACGNCAVTCPDAAIAIEKE